MFLCVCMCMYVSYFVLNLGPVVYNSYSLIAFFKSRYSSMVSVMCTCILNMTVLNTVMHAY